MESLEDMWKSFSLTYKEGFNVDLVDTEQQPENILAAKFLTPRVLNMDVVARTFKPLWKTRHGFTVQDLGSNKIAFVFEDAMDLERVIVNEPWTYDKFLVVFQRVQGDGPIQDSLFSHTSFWVQLHNLPLRRRTEAAAESIGQSIGLVEKVAASDDEHGGENCMRVRVRMEVNRPLCRGRLVKFEEGRNGWIAFRYERLPNFCYWCGYLDHGDKDCDIGLQQRNTSAKEGQQFGAWLRATSDRPPHKTVVIMPGSQPTGRGRANHADSSNHKVETAAADLNDSRSENGTNPYEAPSNLEVDMEIEQNPVFPKPDLVQKSTTEIFNDQLNEIDLAINYLPYGEKSKEINPGQSNITKPILDNGTKSNGALSHNHSPFSSPSRRSLEDISNGLVSKQAQKKSTTKWKKLARIHKPSNGSLAINQPLKRDLLLIEDEPVHGKRLRAELNQCNFGNAYTIENALECMSTNITAVAGPQPCREP